MTTATNNTDTTATLLYSDRWSLSLRFTGFAALVAFLSERLGDYVIESHAEGHNVYRTLDHALQAQKAMAANTYEFAHDRPTATVSVIHGDNDAYWKSHGIELHS